MIPPNSVVSVSRLSIRRVCREFSSLQSDSSFRNFSPLSIAERRPFSAIRYFFLETQELQKKREEISIKEVNLFIKKEC